MASSEIEAALEAGDKLLNLQSVARDMLTALKEALYEATFNQNPDSTGSYRCTISGGTIGKIKKAIAKAEGR